MWTVWINDSGDTRNSEVFCFDVSTLPMYFASTRKGVSRIRKGSIPDWRASVTHVTFASDANVMALLELRLNDH